MTFRTLPAAGLLFAASIVSAADWPQWRGPSRDGHSPETGLLKAWPKDGPPVAWTATNLGLGWGTPSVANGSVYGIGTRGGKDGVWAVKEADGKELWFTPVADAANAEGKQTNGPAGTPSFHNGKLYAVSGNGTVACLNAADGKLVWSKNYVTDFGAQVPFWGFNDSVLADGDKVVCNPCGPKAAVASLKADTGEVVWAAGLGKINTQKEGGGGYSSPIKATVAGTLMVISLLDKAAGIVGLDPATGKLLWQYTGVAAGGGIAQIPTPIVRGDKVWVSCSYTGGAALLQLIPKAGGFDVKELKSYKKPDLNNHHGGMVLVGDHLYFGHDQNQGYPVCVDFNTGDIAWGPVKKAIEGGSGSAATAFADGRLYLRYQNGVMVLVDPSPDDLKVVSAFKLPAANVPSYPQSWPHPVIANGKLFIRDQNAMYAYSIAVGK